jgi:hypothetical protein
MDVEGNRGSFQEQLLEYYETVRRGFCVNRSLTRCSVLLSLQDADALSWH